MIGGIYAFVAQHCEGENINTNAEDKLFGKWSLVQQPYMNHQGVNIDIGGEDRLFEQQSVVEPFDLSMSQYWHHNQH